MLLFNPQTTLTYMQLYYKRILKLDVYNNIININYDYYQHNYKDRQKHQDIVAEHNYNNLSRVVVSKHICKRASQ